MQEHHLKTPITLSFISDIEEMLAGTDQNDPKPAVAPTTAPTTAEPTESPEPPGFEAVFANFFASQKPLLKIQLSLVKLSFLKKGLC